MDLKQQANAIGAADTPAEDNVKLRAMIHLRRGSKLHAVSSKTRSHEDSAALQTMSDGIAVADNTPNDDGVHGDSAPEDLLALHDALED